MLGIGNQGIAFQSLREKLLAKRDGLCLLHLVDSRRQPVSLRGLNNERGPLVVKTVSVKVEPAPLGFLEVEGERIQFSAAAKPDKAVFAGLYVGLEDLLVFPACNGRCSVRSNHQIELSGVIIRIGDFGLEFQLDPESNRASLQYLQQLDARDPAETVSAGGDLVPLEKDVHIVPVAKRPRDLPMRFFVNGAETVHRLIRENNPPAESVIRAIAFNHGYVPRGIRLLHKDGKIKTCGASA